MAGIHHSHRSYELPVHSTVMSIMKVPLLGSTELYVFTSAKQISLTPRHNPLTPSGYFLYL
jgi:hypothetical protein